jgi:hypothetical protein
VVQRQYRGGEGGRRWCTGSQVQSRYTARRCRGERWCRGDAEVAQRGRGGAVVVQRRCRWQVQRCRCRGAAEVVAWCR